MFEDDAEQTLLADIRRVVPGAAGIGASSLDEIEPYVLRELASAGLHAQMGITPPLRELLLWKRQDVRHERVALPSGVEEVTVEMMSDFLSKGWAHFATCGRSSAGGWVGSDRLFAVAESYNLDSENYRVSYLAHEAQHFHDRRAFRELPSWRLEYRAKLVELILADSTRSQILRTFIANQSDDRTIPHSYANGLLVSRLADLLDVDVERAADRLPEYPGGRVAAAADELLRLDTDDLNSRTEADPAVSNHFTELPGHHA